MYFMAPAMIEMKNLMVDNFANLLKFNLNIEIIVLCVFTAGIVFIFLFLWIPYLRSLSTKIWRTKGMLNMIPIDVITKHDSLKNAFISGDILRAVKWTLEDINCVSKHSYLLLTIELQFQNYSVEWTFMYVSLVSFRK